MRQVRQSLGATEKPKRLQVMDFFESLQSLPPQPDVESLREVFKWYNDGFLDGMPYETDPLGAWRKCATPKLFFHFSKVCFVIAVVFFFQKEYPLFFLEGPLIAFLTACTLLHTVCGHRGVSQVVR